MAMFYASVEQGGRILRAWSCAVAGITVNKAVLRGVDEVNRGLTFARVYTRGSSVSVEGCLFAESLQVRDVGVLFTEVGPIADRVGSMLAAVHGGQVAFPGGRDASYECDECDGS
jgi:hypothetical protein